VATAAPVRSVVIGRIGGAHGLRGWLKVLSFTDPPDNLLQHPVWSLRGPDGTATDYRLRDAEFDGRWLRASLEGVEDRDAAELLRGMEVVVARSALPPAGQREYYRDDLLGMEVRNLAGVVLGRVSHFVDAPAVPVMVIRGEREHWVPAAPPHLLRVRLEQGEIDVDWPEEL
jgi:16S rRNA processing protein RimM